MYRGAEFFNIVSGGGIVSSQERSVFMEYRDRTVEFDFVRIARGSVWYVDLGEVAKVRPVLVISINKEYKEYTVIPFTTQEQLDYPWFIRTSLMKRDSWLLCNNVRSVGYQSFRDYVCQATEAFMQRVECGVSYWLGLSQQQRLAVANGGVVKIPKKVSVVNKEYVDRVVGTFDMLSAGDFVRKYRALSVSKDINGLNLLRSSIGCNSDETRAVVRQLISQFKLS